MKKRLGRSCRITVSPVRKPLSACSLRGHNEARLVFALTSLPKVLWVNLWKEATTKVSRWIELTLRDTSHEAAQPPGLSVLL